MKFLDKETGLYLSTDNADSIASMKSNPNKYEEVAEKPQKKQQTRKTINAIKSWHERFRL